MLKEFREFAMKGNMLDLAVGIVLGAAFTTVINSIVKDLLTPIIGMVAGGSDLATKTVTVNGVALGYGSFVAALINFILVAFALFVIVKLINKMRKEKPVEAAAPELTTSEQLLVEIRDSLKTGNKAVVGTTAVTEKV